MGGKVLPLPREMYEHNGSLKTLMGLVSDGLISVEVGAERCGLSVDEFEEKMEAAGFEVPTSV